VLNLRHNDFGVLDDCLHVLAAVIEIVGDTVEQYTDQEEEAGQHSNEQEDDDYRCEDKSHL
jgi:putative N-acetylmannosamine-6-phosphate epimerase